MNENFVGKLSKTELRLSSSLKKDKVQKQTFRISND